MRVVFLDFDGVLNNAPFLLGLPKSEVTRVVAPGSFDWATHLDPVNVTRLQRLLFVAGAYIVISSDWRHYHTAPAIERYLRSRGAPSANVIDRCPDGDRGPSIIDWLNWNERAAERWHPRVESWVALDDCTDMGEAEPRTVRTDSRVGLTDANVDLALSMLGLSIEGVKR